MNVDIFLQSQFIVEVREPSFFFFFFQIVFEDIERVYCCSVKSLIVGENVTISWIVVETRTGKAYEKGKSV